MNYITEKITLIIFVIVCLLLLVLFLYIFQIHYVIIIIFASIYILMFLGLFISDYFHDLKEYQKIVKSVDELEEKYLISTIIKRPKNMVNLGYYYALNAACKAMNDKITSIINEKKDYQEYIETFAHEIKTPIAALSLYADNKGDMVVKEEIQKINNFVEQVLYYARSDALEKDYFVKKLNLEDVVHGVILNYKDSLLNKKISLDIKNLDNFIFTDEKWLSFIISQILQNSIKYQAKKINIYSKNERNKVLLIIRDNGVGISSFDLPRVFEKGFTGSNRHNEYATGMGLYLCQKLCAKLNLDIKIDSVLNKYTEVTIVFPKTDYNLQ